MRERKNFNEEPTTYLSENKIFIIFAAITFVLFIALALFSYNSFIKGQESGEVVLIKADEQPYKVTPEDPGGMKVNYQDKEVFNTLIGKDGSNNIPAQTAEGTVPTVDEPATPLSPEDVLRKEAEAENLAKEAQQAEAAKTEATPSVADAANIAANATTPETSLAGADEAPSAPVETAPATDEATTATDDKKPENVDINSGSGVIKIGEAKENIPAKIEEVKNKLDTSEKAAAVKEKPKSISNKEKDGSNILDKKAATKTAEKATPATSKNGKFFVQLSAYSSTHSLDKGWNDLKKKYGSAINGSKQVNKIERDGKTLYRLGFGPYKQKLSAVEACNKLKAKGQDCIIRQM